MSVAVIQGSSSGIGLQLCRHLLQNTGLKVVATSRSPKEARQKILEGLDGKDDRLTNVELDCLKEDSIHEAASQVKSKFGPHSLRLLINVSGALVPEKAVERVELKDIKHTFDVNTFGHLLTYKHFVPLLPSSKGQSSNSFGQDEDPGKPYLPSNLSIVASLTAKVGSIGDNSAGGWFSYRASKAATNQIIKTLDRQLKMKAVSAIALALHPGTTAYTGISKGFVKDEDVNKKEGIHDAEKAASYLLDVISKQTANDGGKFLSWNGKELPW